MTGNPEVMRALGLCSDRFRIADNPGAISRGGSNQDAKSVTSTESAFSVKVDYFRVAVIHPE
jgi:hypothetical protein